MSWIDELMSAYKRSSQKAQAQLDAGPKLYPMLANIIRNAGYEEALRYKLGKIPMLGNLMAEQIMGPIQAETGTFGGPKAKGFSSAPNKFSSLADKMERFEIDDSAAKMGRTPNNYETILLKDILDHKELYKHYPEFRDIPVVGSDLGGNAAYTRNPFGNDPDSVGAISATPGMVGKDTLLHEIQHAIQEREGFAKGGSPTSAGTGKPSAATQQLYNEAIDAIMPIQKKYLQLRDKLSTSELVKTPEYRQYDALQKRLNVISNQMQSESRTNAYQSLAGEIEARDVASRANLTKEQRARTLPYSSENIPLSDWIVRR